MNAKRPTLRLFLDEGVPDGVGRCFAECGHVVIHLRDAIPTGSPDPLVCTAAEANDAILVGLDEDMKQLARRHGIGQRRFCKLSLIKLSCKESRAGARVKLAMSLREHEWIFSTEALDRRIFVDIGDNAISTKR